MQIAVVIPTRNSRHFLWRSLASVAVQSHAPLRVLIADAGSTDGLADWVRLRWPMAELLPAETDVSGPADLLDRVIARAAAPFLAFLEPGDAWPADHLARLAAAWAETAATGLCLVPNACSSPGRHGVQSVERSAIEPACNSLSALSVRAEALHGRGDGVSAMTIRDEVLRRLGPGTRLVPVPGHALRTASATPANVPAKVWPAWLGTLEAAVRELPADAGALLLDLHAVDRPAGFLNLLGLAVALAPVARRLQAMTPADLSWAALKAAPATTPVLLTAPVPLDLAHATEQLCIEKLIQQLAPRPVRLALRALVPSTPPLLSRLVDTVDRHPDLQLWVNDRVSARYAVSLFGADRVRLVAPPLLALAPMLRTIASRALITPRMFGGADASMVVDLDARFARTDIWHRGFDLDAGRRLALPLARLFGLSRALRGQVLQHAWTRTLLGWAALHAMPGPLAACRLDAALFAGVCGRAIGFTPQDGKEWDFLTEWRAALQSLDVTGPLGNTTPRRPAA